jgi:hypothetical protein
MLSLISILLAVAAVILLALFAPPDFQRQRNIAIRVLAGLMACAAMLNTGCARDTKPDVPHGVIVKPKVVTVTRTEYVRVPAELTDPLPIAEGPLSQCPMVAAERRKTIEKANADRRATRALSGTEAKP